MDLLTPEENPSRHAACKRTAEKQLLILGINFLAFSGAAIIVYGFLVVRYKDTWLPLEQAVGLFSMGGTIVGALLTFLSVYLPPNTRPPEAVSKKYIAPLCIVLVVAIAIVQLKSPVLVHPHVYNGVGILAIAGSLFRTISR
jgi:amino acid transporter